MGVNKGYSGGFSFDPDAENPANEDMDKPNYTGRDGKDRWSVTNAGNKNPTTALTNFSNFMNDAWWTGSHEKSTRFAQAQQDFYTGFTQDGIPLEQLSDEEFDNRYSGLGVDRGDAIWGGEGKSTDNEDRVDNTKPRDDDNEDEVEPVTLTAGTKFDPNNWQLPYTPPESPYAAPAAQDWSAWMFGSPFGGQGGLAYQPGSQEYLSQYIPQNIWGAESGLSEGVLAELAPATGGLLEV